MPNDAAGEPASLIATPCLSTYTPPGNGPGGFGGVPSETNTFPRPNANAVGVLTPVATCWSFAPLAGVGIGGPAADAAAASAPASIPAVSTPAITRYFNKE